MNYLLFWLTKPDPSIADENWSAFQSLGAVVTLITVAAAILAIVALYHMSAKQRKIAVPGDVFAGYAPLWWLALAVPAGLVAWGICFLMYPKTVNSTFGQLGATLEILLLVVLVSSIVSYLLIVTAKNLTPDKFRGRPTHPMPV